MADLAASAVTIDRAWNEGGPAGRDLSCRRVTLALTGQGSAANKITAASLGLTYIEQSFPAIRSDAADFLVCVPSYDGAYLLTLDFAGGAVERTGTYRTVVKGY